MSGWCALLVSAWLSDSGRAGPDAARERRSGRKVRTTVGNFLSTFSSSAVPVDGAGIISTFLRCCKDVRGSDEVCRLCKPDPRISWVSRALPVGLNPEYSPLLLRSLALTRGTLRHCAPPCPALWRAQTSPHLDCPPGLPRRIPPSLPGRVPGMGPVHPAWGDVGRLKCREWKMQLKRHLWRLSVWRRRGALPAWGLRAPSGRRLGEPGMGMAPCNL
ncbi:uncharacterized protein [Pithys albifrons albifrons]|uniref:uncharacterized protein n=1 Tax=Pithys albifrons albifrons TaxID=3385563 RepID=UPI003A5CB752